jgi:ParB-like chromosome segregation protein Spo0J
MEIELHQLDRPYAGLRIRDPRQAARWLASLSQGDCEASLGAVLVVPSQAPDRFVLIDGYARVAALETLRRDTVEAIVLPLAPSEALIFAHRLGSAGPRCALEEAWLLRALHEEAGLSLGELARRFGRSPSWVSRRLALLEALPDCVQEQVRAGAIPAHAAMRCLVPLARANAAQCAQLAERIADAALSAREVERLYVAWRRGDAEVRARIAAHPLLYLRAEPAAQAETDEPPDAGGLAIETLLRDVDVAGAICRRVTRRLVRGLLADPEGRTSLARAFAQTRLAVEALGARLETLADAR